MKLNFKIRKSYEVPLRKITDEAFEKAVVVLDHCAKSTGFYASGLPGGYEATWARDSMIAGLGAGLIGIRFKIPFKKSLELLAKNQSPHGQIPNAVGSYNIERRSAITYNSIDSTLWYLLGHYFYRQTYKDDNLLKKYRQNIKKAFNWLECQDPNEDGLLVQQPTMDWQDAFPHKYGRTINTQALYYAVLKKMDKKKQAERLKKIVNGKIEKYLSLYDSKRGYYLPWAWKKHNEIREEECWFDTLGNLLAIITGLATPAIAEKILAFIKNKNINRPYPCKAIYPPIKQTDKEWRNYFGKSEARLPYHYLNGGIWPFIGGFYISALVKMKKINEAQKELQLLARANYLVSPKNRQIKQWGFQEWLDGVKGKPIGGSSPYQSWSAGTYIYAHECVKKRGVFYF